MQETDWLVFRNTGPSGQVQYTFCVSMKLSMITRVEVWENEKSCGDTGRKRVFPHRRPKQRVRAVRAAHILICSMFRIYYQIGKI